MTSETWPATRWPGDAFSGPTADVAVLAAGVDRGQRTRIRLHPLGRWMARQRGRVGTEVAVSALLADRLPLAPSVVVIVPPAVAEPAAMTHVAPAAATMLGRNRPLTVAVACPEPDRSVLAGRLSMFNLHADALPEALVEAVAAGRRCGLTTLAGNTVLLLQRFVPAIASAVVYAGPDPTAPVRINGRWGLTEHHSPADTFTVPADGETVHETVARKPAASLACSGGTHTVAIPEGWQGRRSLRRDTVRGLAALSREAAVVARSELALDVVLGPGAVFGPGTPVVLRCRPSTP